MNIILVGKSASGKDFGRDYLITQKGFESIISHTTRPPRINETHGKEYFFISEDEFIEADYNNEFLETRSFTVDFNGEKTIWHYGTSLFEFKHRGLLTVSIKDLQGAKQIKEQFPNTKIIYIHCDDNIRRERTLTRNSFDIGEWNRRLVKDNEDFSLDKMLGNVDYYLDNTDLSLEEFKQELDNIIEIIYEEGKENSYEQII